MANDHNMTKEQERGGNKDFDYARLSDKKAEFGRADTVREKGFYILPSELFVNVRARARHDVNLNETLAAVFRNIESSAKGSDSEDDLKGLGKENVRQGFFGQEINLTIYNLCRINMFLHDVNYNHFDIANGDTLIDPKHWIAHSN